MSRLLFEDVFEILKKDPDGKRFDRVSRFYARSDTYQMDLVLDVNVDIYPMEVRTGTWHLPPLCLCLYVCLYPPLSASLPQYLTPSLPVSPLLGTNSTPASLHAAR